MKSPEEIKKMLKQGATAQEWKNTVIDPSQLSFSIGKPLSEEEFKAMMAQRQMTPTVHKIDSSKK
jgi:hypothetical protein